MCECVRECAYSSHTDTHMDISRDVSRQGRPLNTPARSNVSHQQQGVKVLTNDKAGKQ